MAVTTKKLTFTGLHAASGAVHSDFSRQSGQRLQLNGQHCEIYSVVVDTAAAVNTEITTGFRRVEFGMLLDIAGSTTWKNLPVRPKTTSAGVAVVTGSLPVGTYLMVVSGTELLRT